MSTSAPVSAVNEIEDRRRNNRTVALWLLVICAMVFAMVILGGLTRLTHSGLSMTDWKPITGWLPPLDNAAWLAEFERYKQFPEYQKINRGMDLSGFQSIFWFEYSHRVLGRTIGMVFLLPFLVFLWRRMVERSLLPKLWTMFVLGGLQGGLGWWMVASGLVNHPDVSHYRLTAHLGLAVLIYAYGLWIALGLLFPPSYHHTDSAIRIQRRVLGLAVVIFFVILSGGMVAGLDAGFAYNTFPGMNGQWIPDGILSLTPWYLNPLENTITVQFIHRWFALATAAAVVIIWFQSLSIGLSPGVRLIQHLLPAALVCQVSLGIVTLVNVVPLPLAAAHQAGSLVLLTASLAAAHALRLQRD